MTRRAQSRKQQLRRPPTAGKKPGQSNTLRIIAGRWRGRKLGFANAPGLRPTPDRVRETLFNWLQGNLYQARCLDLFAGSGALGFEAASRGAGEVILVESHPQAAAKLQENISLLGAGNIKLVRDDAFRFLDRETACYDIIFLDPPFRKGYAARLLSTIHEKKLLADDGLIYLEHEAEETPDESLDRYEVLKQTHAGQIQSYLLGNAKR